MISAKSDSTSPNVLDTPQIDFINFYLVKTPEDMLKRDGYKPLYTHYVFPDELDLGYNNLTLDFFINSSNLQHLLRVQYDEFTGEKRVEDLLKEALFPQGILTETQDFLEQLNAPFTPPGEKLSQYSKSDDVYTIYLASANTPHFLELHQYLNTFPVWFIDGGTPVDIENEPGWIYFLLYRNNTDFVGMCSCYYFFQSSVRARARISQFIILPPYQKQGHGVQLLQGVYQKFLSDEKIFEITIEDCSEEMQFIRDYLDFQNALPLFNWPKNMTQDNYPDTTPLISTLTQSLKITKNQAHRCAEIFKYATFFKTQVDPTLFLKEVTSRIYRLNRHDLQENLPTFKHIYIHDDSDNEDPALLQKPEVPAILGMKVARQEAAPLEERRARLQELLQVQLEDYEILYPKIQNLLELQASQLE